jgi:C4-dicarboxylate transporter, DctM subunit
VATLRVGEQIRSAILAVSRAPWFVLLLVNVRFLALGCLLDPLAIIIVFVPVFFPLVKAVGIDRVHSGLVTVLDVAIGPLTPPVGCLLSVCAAIGETPIEAVVREVTPVLLAPLVVLGSCTYRPTMVLWSPRLLAGAETPSTDRRSET